MAIINFAGLAMPGDPATYDDNVLYTVNIDRDGDNLADASVHARFGQDPAGNWGVQVMGIPGGAAAHSGPVDTVIEVPGGRVFAGLREDPFHFDFDGFNSTVANCTDGDDNGADDLAFDATRDTFMGTNVTSIAIEMDGPSTLGNSANTMVSMWATTSRIDDSSTELGETL